ncbi:hypothetical protein [Staphylococcus gallinarum]|uniref:hypothetical protein n=1 Tax=Staphylococcus gallinarum TaxID=1293 RepID=UPI0030BC5F22
MKYVSTLISGLLSLITYIIPVLAFNKVLGGSLYLKNGLIIDIFIIFVNILAFIRGDRWANFFFIIFSIIATSIFLFPLWGSLIGFAK